MNAISSQLATVDYLELLTVQLRNQDPIDPVDQEGMINDLTQFAQLEGIEEMNASFADVLRIQELTQGIALVGKSVQYVDAVTGELSTGNVTEMFSLGDRTGVMVNGEAIELRDIVSVSGN